MSNKTVKQFIAAAAVSTTLVAPATAQIAKFQLISPALPGAVVLEPTSSSEGAAAAFLGNTEKMARPRAASLGEMRQAVSIIAGAGQEIEVESDAAVSRADHGDMLGLVRVTQRGEDARKPDRRAERFAAADDETVSPTVLSRPEFDRQVIVRTRTKTPPKEPKIKPRIMWSIGEFR